MPDADISTAIIASRFGDFLVATDAEAVIEVSLPASPSGPLVARGGSALLDEAVRQIEAFLAGERRSFDLPVSSAGTAFQEDVWQAVAELPWGQTATYAEIAEAIGRPMSARPVGQAVGANPLPLIWPCHRVLATGGIGGYGGGLDLKRALLAAEGVAA